MGTAIGVESHLYGPECMSCFTAMTNEKTKLLFIDAEGFDLYMKPELSLHYEQIFDFYRKQPFIKNFQSSFSELLPLVMATKSKQVMKDTIVVE